MPVKKIFIYICFLTGFGIALCQGAAAQQTPQKAISASSPNPVGSGARAVGMGGAFIAVADDATAASWNPAGLTQLMQPEVSFAFSHFSRRDDFSSRSYPEVSGMQKTLVKDLNYFSIAFPFEFLERNMIVSLNYQRLYEFDRDIRTDLTERSTDPPLQYDQKVDFRQKGKLSALSPAFAVEVTPDFALGVTCNIWTDNLFWSNGWESDLVIKGATYRDGRLSSTVKSTDRDRYYGFSGFNMHIGFLWHINSFLTVGGVVKTPFTADMEHEREVVTTSRMIGGLPATGSMRIDEDVELEMPLSYGLGVAMRFTDRLTISFDIYRTEWSHFRLEDGSGNRLNPLTGKPSHESPTRATHQVRLGAEYLFILPKTIIPLRCGLFYDPEPSEKSPEDFWGFSLGTGFTAGNLVFDCAYQYRRGNDVQGDVLVNLPGTDADVTQHLFMTSLIYYF